MHAGPESTHDGATHSDPVCYCVTEDRLTRARVGCCALKVGRRTCCISRSDDSLDEWNRLHVVLQRSFQFR